MNYFILINDVQQGPFTIDELRQRGIRQDTLVWCEGMAQWAPAWQVEELKPLLFGEKEETVRTEQPVAPPPPPQIYDTDNGDDGRQGYNDNREEPPRTPRKGKKKRHGGCVTTVIIVAVILFIMALLNPSMAEHRKAILDKIDTATGQVDKIDDPMVRGVVSSIVGLSDGMVKEIVTQLIDEDLVYHNYIIFSTTTLNSGALRKEIRTSTGFLGHVNAVSLSNMLPDLIMQRISGGKGFDNGTEETTTTTVDSDGNETTETTKTTRRNGITVDSLTRRVTNGIAEEVARKVKSEARQQTDSTTASGIDAIVDDVLKLIKGL